MSAAGSVRLFGIRHHGPGCARSLRAALEAQHPDCLLIEGPPDAEAMLELVGDPDLVPPVALLVYDPESPRDAAFYPFAEFSPEWQALRFAAERGIAVRFMDLPVACRLALDAPEPCAETADGASENAADAPAPASTPAAGGSAEAETCAAHAAEGGSEDGDAGGDAQAPATAAPLAEDPLDWLGRAAGYPDGESWWNRLVEERGDGEGLFEAVREAMTELRGAVRSAPGAGPGSGSGSGSEAAPESAPEPGPESDSDSAPGCLPAPWPDPAPARRHEALREAAMRRCLRQARKDGYTEIAVVCGAWHVPALAELPPAKADDALLKGLPKRRVTATWVPWSYRHLSTASGYGAGVQAPGWYEHLWRTPPERRAAGWMARAARVFRAADLDCSSAHLIEAARLAETLAALRERAGPGLDELNEALQSVVCMGDPAPLHLVADRLTVGDRLGRTPERAPAVALARDLAREQRRLRLKQEANARTLDLDLRQPNDLARSHLFHRLGLLGIDWARLGTSGRSTKGTFHEVWTLRWEPELAIAVVEASRWGNTVVDAATRFTVDRAARPSALGELSALVRQVLLADLSAAIGPVAQALEDCAAVAADTAQMLVAIPPLTDIARYGNVRRTDAGMVARVLDGLVPRAALGLPGACAALDDEAAGAMRAAVADADRALRRLAAEPLTEAWDGALAHLAEPGSCHGLVGGLAARLRLDARRDPVETVALRLHRALSPGNEPAQAAAWLEGFLERSALVLLNDPVLWDLVDAWVAELPEERFAAVLPLLRRAFSAFPGPERRRLGERAAVARTGAGAGAGLGGPPDAGPASRSAEALDPARAELTVPLLKLILGL